MTKQFVYRNPRPVLTIEATGDKQLGNCYSANFWRVTSSRRQLTSGQLHLLNAAGVLGFGQSFRILSQCDGKEAPAGHDIVPCSVVDLATGKVLDEEAVNPYSHKPYQPHDDPFYVYDCESRVDSGD